MQIFDITWCSSTPSKFLFWIFESEIANLIFNIILLKKFYHFINLGIIFDIQCAPLKSWWQWQWLSGYFFLIKLLDLTFFVNSLTNLHDWLSLPKFMFLKDFSQVFKSISLHEVNILITSNSLELLYHFFFTKIRIFRINIQLFHSFFQIQCWIYLWLILISFHFFSIFTSRFFLFFLYWRWYRLQSFGFNPRLLFSSFSCFSCLIKGILLFLLRRHLVHFHLVFR